MKNIKGQIAQVGDQIGFIITAKDKNGNTVVAKQSNYAGSVNLENYILCCESEDPSGRTFMHTTTTSGGVPVPHSELRDFKTLPYIYGKGKNQNIG